MAEIFIIPIMVIYALLLVAGLVGNVFIFVVNLMEWRKKRSLNSCDILVSSLAVSNILLQCLAGVFCFSILFSTNFVTNYEMNSVLMIISLFLLSSSLWLSAWLCADYCVRIINNNKAYFVWLKVTLPKLEPWLGCGSVVVSFITSLATVLDMNLNFNLVTHAIIGNSSAHTVVIENYYDFIYMYIACVSFAFVVCFIAVTSILLSLFKHVKLMERSPETLVAPRFVALFGAAKTVTLLLLLYISVYTAIMLTFTSKASPGKQGFWVCALIILSFPTLNACILVQGNLRLNKAFKRILEERMKCGRRKQVSCRRNDLSCVNE
ncbi:taste receptor type 2 member 9-like [Pelodytes ibericus]